MKQSILTLSIIVFCCASQSKALTWVEADAICAKAGIANAVQRGSTVYVYNEKNQQIFTQPAGSGPNDGLKGYTGSSVNIQRGSTIYTYNEKGQQTGTTPAR